MLTDKQTDRQHKVTNRQTDTTENDTTLPVRVVTTNCSNTLLRRCLKRLPPASTQADDGMDILLDIRRVEYGKSFLFLVIAAKVKLAKVHLSTVH